MVKMEEADEALYLLKSSNLNTRIIPKLGLFSAIN
jgi:hypothetical protein